MRIHRVVAALALVPLLTAATAPPVTITEAYRFGVDPGRLYTLAVRDGKGPTRPLRVGAGTAFGVRSLDRSSFSSGQGRALIELTGPKAIWSAQRTLPGTNLDFVAAAIKEVQPGWLPMATQALSFDMQEFVAVSPPPKDERSFAEHAEAVDWAGSWGRGLPTFGTMLRAAARQALAPPGPLHYGLNPDTVAIEQAITCRSPVGPGSVLMAVARMDNEPQAAEKAFWLQAVFALLPQGKSYRLVPIVEPFAGADEAERYRRRYRIVDLIDRQGNGRLDILLSVGDDRARHLELYGWDGNHYRLLARSPGNGIPDVLE